MTWQVSALQWLSQVALGSLVLAGLGLLGVNITRQPARRQRAIEATLAACLLTVIVSLVPGLPQWTIGVFASGRESKPNESWLDPILAPMDTTATAAPVARSSGTSTDSSSPVNSRESPTPGNAPTLSLPNIRQLAVLSYFVGVFGLAVWWAIGCLAILRLRRRCVPAPKRVSALFREIAGKSGDRVALLMDEQIESPLLFGIRRPIIVLPSSYCQPNQEQALRFCLAHEWSHIEHGDIISWRLATLAKTILFFNPVVWWLRQHLRLCQDYLADSFAASQATAEDYASFLVALARQQSQMPSVSALGIRDRPSNLRRRVLMLLNSPPSPVRRRHPIWNGSIIIVAMVAALTVSLVRLEADNQIAPSVSSASPAGPRTYTCLVTDHTTGKPLAGAKVVLRRRIYADVTYETSEEIGESTHTTDRDGKWTFSVPPEQAAKPRLAIAYEVTHPGYAAHKGHVFVLGTLYDNDEDDKKPIYHKVELQPGKPIAGKLLGPDRTPVAGVRVWVITYPKGEPMGLHDEARSGADGRFQLMLPQVGDAAVLFATDRFAHRVQVIGSKRGDLGTIQLERGARLAGRVVDENGRPVAGCWVTADQWPEHQFFSEHSRLVPVGASARTGPDGSFVLPPIGSGVFQVRPDEVGRYAAAPTQWKKQPLPAVYLQHAVTVEAQQSMAGASIEPVELRPVPSATVEATVTNSKGEPVRRYSIHVAGKTKAQDRYWQVESIPDQSGLVRLRVPRGLTDAYLSAMLNRRGVWRYQRAPGEKFVSDRDLILGTITNDILGVRIVFEHSPQVLVRLTTADGHPLRVPYVTASYVAPIDFKPGNWVVKENVTSQVGFDDAGNGSFRSWQLLPDREVVVTAHAYGCAPRSEKIKLPEGAEKEVVFALARDPQALERDLQVAKQREPIQSKDSAQRTTERKAMQGAWVRTMTIINGNRFPPPPGQKMVLLIEGDKFLYGGMNGTPERFELDPDVLPKAIDCTPLSDRSGPLKNVTYFGIYTLENDTLTLCRSIRGNSLRPLSFDTAINNGATLDVYERIKNPDPPK